MAMVVVDTIAAYRQTSDSSRLAWSKGRQPCGTVLHSSDEPGELLQWLCCDDITINILMSFTITTAVEVSFKVTFRDLVYCTLG